MSAGQARRTGLDALRGIAVVLMVEQHLGVWITTWSPKQYPYMLVLGALGGLAAPLFVLLAGVGSGLALARGPVEADRTLARRGLVLLCMGLALNFLTPSWFRWGSWFVLHLLGFAILTTPLWRRTPRPALLGVVALVLLIAWGGQTLLDTPRITSNARMSDMGLPGAPWRMAAFEGHFPIAPWLATYLIGLWIGRAPAAARARAAFRIGGTLFVIAACMAAAAWLKLPFAHSSGGRHAFGMAPTFYPATTITIIFLTSVAALLTSFALTGRWSPAPRHALVGLGRVSLTLVFIHLPLFRELTRPIGVWRGLSPPVALGVTAGFLLLAALLSQRWERVGYRGGAEWLLRKLAPYRWASRSTAAERDADAEDRARPAEGR